ncbi:MAG: choice-of-anchor tandem repeat GloVer-containing protein [Terriglobales bacterium]
MNRYFGEERKDSTLLCAMVRHTMLRRVCIAAVFCVASALVAQAQSFSLLYGFPEDGTLGYNPFTMNMIQATDGNLYGTTESGGAGNVNCNNYVDCGGTIFRITPAGSYTLLYTFCISTGCPDGRSPYGGIIQASDGNFYGMTPAGGTYNDGTIFRLTPEGAFTVLHSFCDPPNTCNPNDGSAPGGQLLQASNAALYGITSGNTLFKITTKGKFTLLYAFPNGTSPQGNLVQIPSGTIYGVTKAGGVYAQGSIYKATLGGKVTTLYSFCAQQGCPDGQHPSAGLALGNDGDLYGETFAGGPDGYGTVFKITTKGKFKFTLLHQFTGFQNGGTDGGNPIAPMVLGSDGNLYGTTENYGGGGYGGTGSVYEVADGAYASVYGLPTDLCTLAHPYGGLVQGTDGNFYGSDNGTCLIGFSVGLGPFVQPIPTFGKAGKTKVIIQGTDLTGATSVAFNGKSATFEVVSATEITTTVPTGATTGAVKVVTPGGTLEGNVAFTVK